MPILSGTDLESYGAAILLKMDLKCLSNFPQVRLQEIDPNGSHSRSAHLEIDYLVPTGNTCLVGEITSRRNVADIRRKYTKFKNNIDLISRLLPNSELWRYFDLEEDDLRAFRQVEHVRGFFILPNIEYFDVQLEIPENLSSIVIFEKDWELIKQYSDCIGKYAKNHFLYHFGIVGEEPIEFWNINRRNNYLIVSLDKKIAGENIGFADLFTFEISPFSLLPYAQVLRKDEMPDINPGPNQDYQRPLISKKLQNIREKLLIDPDFIFPNSILIILSTECEYQRSRKLLRIPMKFGAISVIDGQHRLFSYANDNIEAVCREHSKIMVTAIKFRDENQANLTKYSAYTFIEINSNQTKVHYSHTDAIAYEILGQTNSRALAAQVILMANKRIGSSLFGLFHTYQTLYGKIQTMTVLSVLKRLCDFDYFRGLTVADRGVRLNIKNGYKKLFEIESISEINEVSEFINRCERVLAQYFSRVSRVYTHDWPRRKETIGSSLEYTKMVAAFVKLLWTFIREAKDWDAIQADLISIKNNIMELRSLDEYDQILFDPHEDDIPSAQQSVNDMFKFLNANREDPTSIEDV